MPHYSVSSNLALLDKKMKIGRRAEAFRPEGFDEQPSSVQVLHT
jgi:hypothetical protein